MATSVIKILLMSVSRTVSPAISRTGFIATRFNAEAVSD
ncbi:hypothetical protein CZ787_03805 [Halomonas citrativorans]|uniref:Uncharacterized protein n=1 Tax=Halomonas citrativorans TaxID=2742612 RepID=A0A1R4HSM9_9GAMM|nr:hypothetical protein CZ787_03805 [Halomonas citrativorans]